MQQPPLPFTLEIPRLPFQQGEFNASALAILESWFQKTQSNEGHPTPIALIGFDRCGKTRLAQHLTDRHGGGVLHPDDAGDYNIPAGTDLLVLDDVHQASPMALFAIYNQSLASRRPTIFTGRGRPEHWGQGGTTPPPPDLISRLSSLPKAELDSPSAKDIIRAVKYLLTESGVQVSQNELTSVVEKSLRRRFDAAEALAQAVVKHSLDDQLSSKELLHVSMLEIPAHQL